MILETHFLNSHSHHPVSVSSPKVRYVSSLHLAGNADQSLSKLGPISSNLYSAEIKSQNNWFQLIWKEHANSLDRLHHLSHSFSLGTSYVKTQTYICTWHTTWEENSLKFFYVFLFYIISISCGVFVCLFLLFLLCLEGWDLTIRNSLACWKAKNACEISYHSFTSWPWTGPEERSYMLSRLTALWEAAGAYSALSVQQIQLMSTKYIDITLLTLNNI